MSQSNLLRLEQAVLSRDYNQAYLELLQILQGFDQGFGLWRDENEDYIPQQARSHREYQQSYLATRLANAITAMFMAEDFHLTEQGALQLLVFQRWLAVIFASSPYWNADHVLQSYNLDPDSGQYSLPPQLSAFLKFAVLYLPESNIPINLDALWQATPGVTAALCFALQTSRFIATEQAFGKRALILQWFPEKLAQVESLEALPIAVSHDVYMHCSYDTAANKHDIKKALNELIRRTLLRWGWEDRDVGKTHQRDGKPVMLVLLEHFNAGHSIYRTHSTSLMAARERFHVIGVGKASVDEVGRAVFDSFHELQESASTLDHLWELRRLCELHAPSVLYMPSIGMDLLTVFASNVRLAPIQAVALGHPATTHSDFIEYVLVEDDYVGDEACFSERLLRLPADALPYVPSGAAPSKVEYLLRPEPAVVQIGIAATTMKLNPYFLRALQAIQRRAQLPILFHFAVGQCTGMLYPYVKRFIQSYLGDAALVYPHQHYQDYLQTLQRCDLLLNPFPFGNTNGIIDMVTLGLVGICKTGPEVHEHIDEALFARLGLPNWLVAQTADEYVEKALRLIHNHEERLQLRRDVIAEERLQRLFSGDARPLGRLLWEKVQALQPAAPAKSSKKASGKGTKKPSSPRKKK